MSVMIKGLEMPSKCWSCPCCVDNGLIGMDREYFCSALDSDFEIDNLFQGEEAYNEVMNNADYFLAPVIKNNVLMIEG